MRAASRRDRPGAPADALAFHAAFAAVAALALAAPWPSVVLPAYGTALGRPPTGWLLLGLVVLYNVALPVVGRRRGHERWVRLWAFLVPLGAFQVVPDAFLADVVGSLDFPDTGGPRLGPVPLAMAGMWTVPLWLSTYAGLRARSAWVAAAVAGVLLVGAEATLWVVPIWRAVGVTAVGPVAVYVVLPEILLGAATFAAFRWGEGRRWPQRVAAAAVVSVLYLGALGASYWLVERVLG